MSTLRRIQLAAVHLVVAAGLIATSAATTGAGTGLTSAHGNKHLGKGNKHNMINCGAFGWDGQGLCI